MRIFVISDMEGVAGITRWEQCGAGQDGYQEGRKLYTEEINAAVRGAFDGGATEVVVMDCHGAGKGYSFNSLVHADLDPRCEYVVQNEWTEYTGFLEQGCDAALFVAMHAMAGNEKGVLSHTVSGTNWHRLKFNGTEVGETGINAALCGHWNTPVLLVTGDRAVCEEAEALLGPHLKTVAVKEGLERFSARHIAPQRAREMIQEASAQVVSNPPQVPPYDPGKPCEIEVTMNTTDQTEPYQYREGVEILDGRRILSRAGDWWTAWRQMYF